MEKSLNMPKTQEKNGKVRKLKTMMLLGAGFPMVFKSKDFRTDGNIVDICTTESITKKLRSRVYNVMLKSEHTNIEGCLDSYNSCYGNYYNIMPGEIIYRLLKRQIPETNFETIINALESLISYYNGNSSESEVLFGIDNELSQILSELNHSGNCIVVDQQPQCHGNYRCKEVKFLETIVFKDFMQDIIEAVAQYDSYVRLTNARSSLLQKYVNNLIKDNVLRVYTTNYDNTFSYLFPEKFFNGFSDKIAPLSYDSVPRFKVDAEGILNNLDNVCYNMHGSIFWIKENMMSDRYCYRPENPGFYSSNMKGTDIGNPGELILSSPIVTGYRKSQRVMQYPFSLFYNSFERDIYGVGRIIVCGYSFGDPHINSQLRVAVERGVKLEIVTFIRDDIDIKSYCSDIIKKLNIEDETFNDYVIIHIKGIVAFLEKQLEGSVK